MKRILRESLERVISQHTRNQQKEIVVTEVIRLLMDEPAELGVCFTPAIDQHTQLSLKTMITETLLEMYSRYTAAHASLGDIVTDALYELDIHGLSVTASEKSFA